MIVNSLRCYCARNSFMIMEREVALEGAGFEHGV